MTLSGRVQRSEDGAILLYALIFLTVIALMVTALMEQADSSFSAVVALRGIQAKQYAADAAVQEAMTSLAYTPNWLSWPGVGTGWCPTSPGTTNPVFINGMYMQANCTYLSSRTHQVEISACPSSATGVLTPPVTDCPTPLLRAFVTVSQSGPNPVYVTINDWSVLYGSNS